jgi:quercetin dioxygenase-like cupin family protein
MKRVSKLLLCTVLFATANLAYSIEASDAVKVTPLLKTQETWDGKPIVYPTGKAEITGMLIEVAPGGETGWHLHPVPSFGMVMEGELEVELKSGKTRVMKAGESVAETINELHNGRNKGSVPVKLLVFYAGETGQPLTIKDPAAK